MSYLLDSNAFIEAKNQYYRFSFCPGYWDWILKQNSAGKVFSIDKVRAELRVQEDDLADWVKVSAGKLFIGPPAEISAPMTLISSWVDSQEYTEPAIRFFLASADYYIISYAKSLGYTVVTREKSEPNRISRVKIPDVCLGVGVECIDPFQMLEDEDVKFVC